MLYNFDFNESVDDYCYFYHIKLMFYCCGKSFEYLNSRKLSDLCSKIYKKLLN